MAAARMVNCPEFSGKSEEYEEWRQRAVAWMKVYGNKYETAAWEMIMSMKGRALAACRGIKEAMLETKDGVKEIFDRLDGEYRQDRLIDRYARITKYIRMERKKGENMKEFLSKYERRAEECKNLLGYELLKGEPKAMHLVMSASLDKVQKEVILGGGENEDGELDYEKVKRNLSRIFGESEKKNEQEEWYEGERIQLVGMEQ